MHTAKLFANGKSQAVRLPREFRFEGEEVVVRRVGDAVLLLPLKHSARELKALLEGFGPDFKLRRLQPRRPQRRRDKFLRDLDNPPAPAKVLRRALAR